MSEAHRSDSAHAPEAAAGADRDAKIEQLLLVGLDHYFAGRYEQAINVWTRALFLDRSHARARAYIERARSALAEGQRESEELLQNGVAAFKRGDGDEARRLLQTAIERGAPSEEALAVLDRLNRLETTTQHSAVAHAIRVPAAAPAQTVRRPPSLPATLAISALIILVVTLAGYMAASSTSGWRGLFEWPDAATTTLAAPVTREAPLALPRRGETALARARSLAAGGHLRDALAALDGVRPTDPERADADLLRGDIQRQLVALAAVPPPAPPREKGGEKGDRPVP